MLRRILSVTLSVGLALFMALPALPVKAATTIDVGPGATNRASTMVAGRTYVDNANPANLTGTITSVQVWANSGMNSSTTIGTFYLSSPGNFTCRASQVIGAVTAGSAQTFAVSLEVQSGDYLGIYFASGLIEEDDSGGSTVTYEDGNLTTPGNIVNELNIVGGAISIYATGTAPPPTVATATATVTTITSVLTGNITVLGADTVTNRGFEWGTSSGVYPNSWSETGSYSTGTFTRTLSGLTPNVTYYYRAFATNTGGTGNSAEATFATSALAATNGTIHVIVSLVVMVIVILGMLKVAFDDGDSLVKLFWAVTIATLGAAFIAIVTTALNAL